MTTREYILNALSESGETPVSGASMARNLNLSRNAIWKTIDLLKEEGYDIRTIGKTGYIIHSKANVFDKDEITKLLQTEECEVRVRRSSISTNKTAKNLALQGKAGHGTVVVSNMQGRGRGRYGKEFVSPPKHGVYLSVILDPAKLPFSTPTMITPYAAVAVAEAIEETCKKSPLIKWVNDLFLDGKKICGILAETAFNPKVSDKNWIILGIGINVTPSVEHEKYSNIIGTIFDCEIKDLPVTRNEIAAAIVNRIMKIQYTQEQTIAEYRKRLFIIGKTVKINGEASFNRRRKQAIEAVSYYAVVKDVTETGELLVQNEAGETITVSAGEVSLEI
ncbi:MAG: biotin--[acetyl-CoA-carboxylase] ligase [Firmicutes bacterium]|nr:biotin--[acetyl-CoA-carboxylase] ligase [Bacillota bacterium]